MKVGAAKKQYRDPGTSIFCYAEECLVRCPECDGCARVTKPNGRAKLVCACCGHFAEREPPYVWPPFSHAKDPSFQRPLWLQTACHGKLLWAYNPRHLSDIASLVEAELREHGRDYILGKRGASSRTMAASLPSWVIAAKNRPDVLRGIARLRKRLEKVK